MRNTILVFALLMSSALFAQERVFVVDSIMNEYMESGYANKHFMPKGKYDKYDKRTGNWKDYEVRFDNVFLLDDKGLPIVKSGAYLIYGKGEFLRGKRIGEWKLYVLEDKSFKKIHYKTVRYREGKDESDATYHFPNGKTAATASLKNGKIEGELIQYYPNGDVSLISNFLKSKLEGKVTSYFPSGKVQYEKSYVGDSLHGTEVHYYENGNIQWSQEYDNGTMHGTYKYFHENGQVWTEKIYKDGLVDSVVASYASNGEKLDHGTLENGTGTVKYYQHTGELYLIETYEDGVVVSEDRSGEFDW